MTEPPYKVHLRQALDAPTPEDAAKAARSALRAISRPDPSTTGVRRKRRSTTLLEAPAAMASYDPPTGWALLPAPVEVTGPRRVVPALTEALRRSSGDPHASLDPWAWGPSEASQLSNGQTVRRTLKGTAHGTGLDIRITLTRPD